VGGGVTVSEAVTEPSDSVRDKVLEDDRDTEPEALCDDDIVDDRVAVVDAVGVRVMDSEAENDDDLLTVPDGEGVGGGVSVEDKVSLPVRERVSLTELDPDKVVLFVMLVPIVSLKDSDSESD
jgi:hypothetical protein